MVLTCRPPAACKINPIITGYLLSLHLSIQHIISNSFIMSYANQFNEEKLPLRDNVKIHLIPVCQYFPSLSLFYFGSHALQENPVAFEREYKESPVRALLRVEEVLSLYLHLITTTNTSLNWTCGQEYSSVMHDYSSIMPPTVSESTSSTGDHMCAHTNTKPQTYPSTND